MLSEVREPCWPDKRIPGPQDYNAEGSLAKMPAKVGQEGRPRSEVRGTRTHSFSAVY